MDKNKYTICGVHITNPSSFALSFDHELKFVTTVNAEIALLAESNDRLRNIINSGLVVIDGFWTLWALRKKYRQYSGFSKFSGSSYIYDTATIAASLNKKVLLIGASYEVNKKAVDKLKEISGYDQIYGYSPEFSAYPFSDSFNTAIKDVCYDIKPEIVILGFGVPKQEYWAEENREFLQDIGASYVMFFGGAIDIVAGKFKRAPTWIQNVGLESLYRLVQDPKRIQREINKLKFIHKAIFGNV